MDTIDPTEFRDKLLHQEKARLKKAALWCGLTLAVYGIIFYWSYSALRRGEYYYRRDSGLIYGGIALIACPIYLCYLLYNYSTAKQHYAHFLQWIRRYGDEQTMLRSLQESLTEKPIFEAGSDIVISKNWIFKPSKILHKQLVYVPDIKTVKFSRTDDGYKVITWDSFDHQFSFPLRMNSPKFFLRVMKPYLTKANVDEWSVYEALPI